LARQKRRAHFIGGKFRHTGRDNLRILEWSGTSIALVRSNKLVENAVAVRNINVTVFR
jgi:hypothetical protein